MARRLIIDDRTGVLYEDFTARRIASLDEFFNAEAGATETVEVFSINVNPQTRAVTANTILTANVSLDIGVPRAKPTGGKLTVTYGSDTSGEIPIETLTAETLSSALNRLDAMETAGGCDVWRAGEDDSELSFYVRLQNNGAPGTNPSFDCDGATPPAIGEVTVVKTGASSERALWLVTIAEKPVASIAESAWSTVTSGSFGGLTASLALNGAGLLAHLSKEDPGDLTLTVKNSSSAIYRGTLRAFPSVDPNDLNGSSIHAIFPQIVTSGSNPTVNDDTNDGYGVGTLWINTSTPSAFLLMANGAGAANWDELTETATGQLLLTGGTMTGNIAFSGSQTVDGRDVSADGTKLDGIEASADVTDATNVTAAGALMDSELTDLAGVKGVTISTLQVKPSEGAFANGDKTKLDAIEAGADVTDATNVTAAGALMDSECAGLAAVKATTGTFLSADESKLDGIEASADVTDATNVSAAGALMKSGGTMSGTLDFGSEAMSNGIWSGGALGGNLQGGGYKVTGMAAGTAAGDSINFGQLAVGINDQTGTTYTLVAADGAGAGKQVRLNNASTVTVTVPNNTIEVGSVINLFRKGSGGVTIAAATGVTINSVGAKLKLANQYSGASLICISKGASSEFDLVGDLKA